ncbi:type-2 ice-structuring protein-like [Kryptolebias marmoratus]|uniref:Type-2 ice-structuring protein-like n=1 Tax=Kryptolebias marmoratus TaxID=37003 RepID=A0A3Q2ZHP9_KRYMA|nr:type-2 ice-structuring protein-like [Kryptolebias marmoratus]
MKMPTLPLLLCALVLLNGVAESHGWRVHCPSGWNLLYGRCFKYVSTRVTWIQAERSCMFMGGNLASVRSYAEYRAIQGLIQRYSHWSGLTWIGGSDAVQERSWLWSDGTRMTYSNWCPGRNNYSRSFNCLRMNYTSRKCWDDHTCTDRHPFVCVLKRTWYHCRG